MDIDIQDRPAPLPPAADCQLCPRLAAERQSRPANSRGSLSARVLIVAMGSDGHPHDTLLLSVLQRCGRIGTRPDADGGVPLLDTRITQAVRCVPGSGLPEPSEVNACNGFLAAEFTALTQLRGVLALGALAHAAVLQACGIPGTRFRFRHGTLHTLPDGLILADCHALSRFRGAAAQPDDTLAATLLALLNRLDAPE